MRQGGKILAAIMQDLIKKVEPGITPKDISAIAAREIKNKGMQPVVLGYDGFPDVICISVNDNIVHGIPSKAPLKDGDVLKLDLTLGYKGYVTDHAVTISVGSKEPSKEVERLINGTKRALDMAIAAVRGDGTRVGDISATAQKVLEQHNLGIIRDLVGHGIGQNIHEEPNVPNYGLAGTGPILPAGATICIEPMASLGDWHIKVAKDGSTIAMADGSLGAHFEHTVLVTDDSAEILTLA
jgi:methionyl aminopeptidase